MLAFSFLLSVNGLAENEASHPGGGISGEAAGLQELHEAGPAGLEALLNTEAEKVSALRRNQIRLDDPEVAELRQHIDTTAAQRDAYASGLFWFTDLEAAKAEARKTRRPILSLRLLGNLDEEYSCANSRFFRTVLYANTEISRTLRDHYVLHWKSVRPAPLLTIDMGDGRRIKRTITGNSIHYLLDPDGRVLDALPGLYSPQAFLTALARAERNTRLLAPDTIASTESAPAQPNEFRSREELLRWHGREANSLCMEWLSAAVKAGAYDQEIKSLRDSKEEYPEIIGKLKHTAFPAMKVDHSGTALSTSPPQTETSIPTLEDQQTLRFGQAVYLGKLFPNTPLSGSAKAAKIETTREFPYPTEFDPPKAMVERPILQQSIPQGDALPAQDPASSVHAGPALAERMTPALWSQIAEPIQPDVALDESSRRFMMQKLPVEILTPSELATGNPDTAKSPFGLQLQRFEAAIARDTVRNEYYYHNRIHQILEEDHDGHLTADVEALNRRIYAELFLTPDYDAWLGLVPEDTYTALEKDGCACDKGAPPMRQHAGR